MIVAKSPKFYVIANKPLGRFMFANNPLAQCHYEIPPECFEYISIPNNVIRKSAGTVYSNCFETLLLCIPNFRIAIQELCEEEFFQFVLIKFDGTFETTDYDVSELYDQLIDIIHTPHVISDSDIFEFINKMVNSGQLQVSEQQIEVLNEVADNNNDGDDWKKDATYDYYRGLRGSM